MLTVAAVTIIVVLSARWSATCSSGGRSRWDELVNVFMLAGLMIPPAVVPTI